METSNLKPVYDCNYFIQKFEAIPEELWCTQLYQIDKKYCALGHCGMRGDDNYNGESLALFQIIIPIGAPIYINDGREDFLKYGKTPKQRILAALYDIKKMQEPKVKEVIRYVAVDPVIKKMEVVLS